MNTSIRFETRFGRAALLTALLLITLCSSAAFAQTWEYLYDGSGDVDGRKRVKAVAQNPGCGAAGYISVGTIDRTKTNSDVYIVRTDANGVILWANRYDVTANGDHDEGWSIYELPNFGGYIVTGHTFFVQKEPGVGRTDSDVFILVLDCQGQLLSSNTYGSTFRNEQGRDIIQATTGDPSDPDATKPTDYIVAGWANNPSGPAGDEDGYLLRVHINNNLVLWDATYDTNPLPSNEAFYGLVQLAPRTGQTTGDILAVGGQNSPTSRAFVVRVNGNNGTIGAAPQGAALYGGVGTAIDFFYSALELQSPVERNATTNSRNVVIVGGYNDQLGTSDIYAVKLSQGDPNVPTVERRIGVAGHHQYATDIREIPFSTNGYGTLTKQWHLILTGAHVDPNGTDPGEALLLSLMPGSLMPSPAVGSLLGPIPAARKEEGWSLFPVDPLNDPTGTTTFGFVVAGWAYTPGNPGLMPANMYVAKTNGFGATGCSNSYAPTNAIIQTRELVQVAISDIGGREEHKLSWQPHEDRLLFCAPTVAKLSGGEAMADDGLSLETTGPNPVLPGTALTMTVAGNDSEFASLTITNSLGEIVRRFDSAPVDEAGQISISTEGWAPGVYVVTLHSGGGERISTKVVVTE